MGLFGFLFGGDRCRNYGQSDCAARQSLAMEAFQPSGYQDAGYGGNNGFRAFMPPMGGVGANPYYASMPYVGGYGGRGGFGGGFMNGALMGGMFGGLGGGGILRGALMGGMMGGMMGGFGGFGRGGFFGRMLGFGLAGLIGRFMGRGRFMPFNGGMWNGGGGGWNGGGGGWNGGGGYDNGYEPTDNSTDRNNRNNRDRDEPANQSTIKPKGSAKAEQVVDTVQGVSDNDKDRAKTMTKFEQRALELINDYRAQHGLNALQFDPRLQLIALVQSKYQNNFGLGHYQNTPGWQTPGQRMAQVGLRGWAENAAYGAIGSADQLVNMWINSPAHRAALLAQGTKMGVSKYGAGATFDMV